MKLSQNEKLIEGNKNMIMYLNKNLNNTATNPFNQDLLIRIAILVILLIIIILIII